MTIIIRESDVNPYWVVEITDMVKIADITASSNTQYQALNNALKSIIDLEKELNKAHELVLKRINKLANSNS